MALQRPAEAEWKKTSVSGVWSKELVGREEGTLKLIRLDPSALFPVHEHPERTEYACVLEGTPTLFDGETHHLCRPGDVVTFPARTPHSLANPTATPVVLLVGAIFHR